MTMRHHTDTDDASYLELAEHLFPGKPPSNATKIGHLF